MKNVFQRILIALSVLTIPGLAHAQPRDPGVDTGLGTNLTGAIQDILQGALSLVGIIAIAFIIFGGFRYVISQGDEGATKTARNTIFYAVIGLIVTLIAGALVSFVFTNLV